MLCDETADKETRKMTIIFNYFFHAGAPSLSRLLLGLFCVDKTE